MQKLFVISTLIVLLGIAIFIGFAIYPDALTPPVDPASYAITATFCAETTGVPIMAWEIFGSPTPTPTREGLEIQPTPTLPPGNAARGENLFQGDGACWSCHDVETGEWYVGPSLKGIAARAGLKKAGLSAIDYLYGVLMEPDANIIPQTRPGIMPRSYTKKLNEGQIADLIAYLLTLE